MHPSSCILHLVSCISKPIFEDLSWEKHDDRVAGLVGPNGCGKSTLLKLIHGDLSTESGLLNRQPTHRGTCAACGYTCPPEGHRDDALCQDGMAGGAGEQ
ncbi:MAG: ATP-binding cassette domain-containing protein [Chloroflexi bacterium]|nr:ATP-binding cassette domain-containing protein [Chloroflexota bacterium]